MRRRFSLLRSSSATATTTATTTAAKHGDAKRFGDLLRGAKPATSTTAATTAAGSSATNNTQQLHGNKAFVRDVRSLRNRVKLDDFTTKHNAVLEAAARAAASNNGKNDNNDISSVLLCASFDSPASMEVSERLQQLTDRVGYVATDTALFEALRVSSNAGDLKSAAEILRRITRERRGALPPSVAAELTQLMEAVCADTAIDCNSGSSAGVTPFHIEILRGNVWCRPTAATAAQNASTCAFTGLADLRRQVALCRLSSVSRTNPLTALSPSRGAISEVSDSSKVGQRNNNHDVVNFAVAGNAASTTVAPVGGALYSVLRPHVASLIEDIFQNVATAAQQQANLISATTRAAVQLDLLTSKHVDTLLAISKKVSTDDAALLDEALLAVAHRTFVEHVLLQQQHAQATSQNVVVDRLVDFARSQQKDNVSCFPRFRFFVTHLLGDEVASSATTKAADDFQAEVLLTRKLLHARTADDIHCAIQEQPEQLRSQLPTAIFFAAMNDSTNAAASVSKAGLSSALLREFDDGDSQHETVQPHQRFSQLRAILEWNSDFTHSASSVHIVASYLADVFAASFKQQQQQQQQRVQHNVEISRLAHECADVFDLMFPIFSSELSTSATSTAAISKLITEVSSISPAAHSAVVELIAQIEPWLRMNSKADIEQHDHKVQLELQMQAEAEAKQQQERQESEKKKMQEQRRRNQQEQGVEDGDAQQQDEQQAAAAAGANEFDILLQSTEQSASATATGSAAEATSASASGAGRQQNAEQQQILLDAEKKAQNLIRDRVDREEKQLRQQEQQTVLRRILINESKDVNNAAPLQPLRSETLQLEPEIFALAFRAAREMGEAEVCVAMNGSRDLLFDPVRFL